MYRLLSILWGFIALSVGAVAQTNLPPFTASDRVVVVAPHPDDEVLGTGGVIQQALAAGADVRVIYLTNGDHNQIAFKLYKHSLFLRPSEYVAFGEQRRAEAIAATRLLGLTSDHLVFLGYPDWGTLRIWRDYWRSEVPFRSDATRATAVPYKEDFSYQHPYRPQAITADFETLFRCFRPTKVFVTHPCDTNPDHRAASNFVRLALLDLHAEGLRPQLYFYVIHFGAWPRPVHYHPDLELKPPRLLLDDGDWMSAPLTPEQTQCKYQAILENRTQLTDSEYALVSYARANELFATIGVPHMPNLPPDLPLDWRKAVRTKATILVPGEFERRPNDSESARPSEEAVALDETMFLRQGNDLIAQVALKNRLGKRTNVHLLLYGYKRGEDFARLPKIKIDITPLGDLHVYDGDRRLANHGITLMSVANRFFVRVPLQLLGGASVNLVFTATRANLGQINPDDTAWRIFAIVDGQTEPAASLVFPNPFPKRRS